MESIVLNRQELRNVIAAALKYHQVFEKNGQKQRQEKEENETENNFRQILVEDIDASLQKFHPNAAYAQNRFQKKLAASKSCSNFCQNQHKLSSSSLERPV